MAEVMSYIYPKSPSDLARECVQTAVPEVMRFDGQNHLTWTFCLPDGLGYEGDGSDELMDRDDFKKTLHDGLDNRESNEGIQRDVIEGSIMPIFADDYPLVGLPNKIEVTE